MSFSVRNNQRAIIASPGNAVNYWSADNSQNIFNNNNGSVNIQKDLIFQSNNVVIGKNGVPSNGYSSDNLVLIGTDVSDLEGYSTYIHGKCLGGGYFNMLMGYDSTMPYGVNNTVVLGPKITTVGAGSLCVGSKANSSINGTSVGHQAGTLQSRTSSFNTMIGRATGFSIVNGSSNIALGSLANFPGDVTNCISINNQNNSSFGGIYGINMGSSNFQLGINKNDPTATLDVSGNISTNFLSKNLTIPGKLITYTDISTSGNTILDLSAITLNSFNFSGGTMVLTGNYRLQTSNISLSSSINSTFVIKNQAGTVIATGPDISGVPSTSTTFLQIPSTPFTYSSNFSGFGGQTLRLDMSVNKIIDISQNIDLQNVRLTFRYPSRVLTLDASTNSIRVGIGTSTPATSSILDLSSNNQGFLPPRMTVGQVLAIPNPSEGLIVYTTDTSGSPWLQKGWFGFNGTTWQSFNF